MAKINLAPRERRLLSIMLVVMIGMTITPIYRSISAKHELSITKLNEAHARLNEVTIYKSAILEEREGQKAIQSKLKTRPRSFDLYSSTNQWIKKAKIADRADLQSKGLNSREAAFQSVQITLNHVNMNEILNLLHEIYASKSLITMQRMAYLRPARDGKGLECAIVMTAPKRR